MDKTQTAVSLFDKYADSYQAKYMDVRLYHDTFDVFCANIKTAQAEILELACGPGNITRYLLQQRPDFKILATDLSPKMLELAQINNPKARVQLMDCRDIDKLGETYDAIMCGFCLPYLSKEAAIQLIQDASAVLKPKGLLYISTMEDAYTKSGLQKSSQGDEIYMYFHEAVYLWDAFKKNGFTPLLETRKSYPAPDGSTTVDLILIARRS